MPAKMKKQKTLAEQIADLDYPAPKDFDPEEPEDHSAQASTDEGVPDDGNEGYDGREHYEVVGKSKLRKPEEVEFGPQYKGSRVSLEALVADGESDSDPFASGDIEEDGSGFKNMDGLDIQINGSVAGGSEDEDINSNEAFGDSDIEKFKNFSFRGSSTMKIAQNKTAGSSPTLNGKATKSNSGSVSESESGYGDEFSGLDSEDDSREEEEAEDEDMISGDSDGTEDPGGEEDEDMWSSEEDEDEGMSRDRNETSTREELRKMMAQEQKIVVASISEAAKADAEKGQAVKAQRSTFDALLNIRIRLQKSLASTNSLSALKATEGTSGFTENDAVKAAELAAARLWNVLNSLREDISHAQSEHSNAGSKRKREVDILSLEEMWSTMQTHESQILQIRRATLEKWSAKVRGTSTLPPSRKLNNTTVQQTITGVLEEQLAQSERLVKRTKVPRSCAPVQAQKRVIEDDEIFDDADFYQMLLKELVDQRMLDSSNGSSNRQGEAVQWTAVREAKTKKNVDTKASKGRKLRYTVHEKLQNFMAPQDVGTWGQRQIDELFGSLLGQKTRLQEDAESGDEDQDMHGEESLKLFRSAA